MRGNTAQTAGGGINLPGTLETGKAIFKILILCPNERTLSNFFNFISITYKINIKLKEQISEITSAKIREMQIYSTPFEIFSFYFTQKLKGVGFILKYISRK